MLVTRYWIPTILLMVAVVVRAEAIAGQDQPPPAVSTTTAAQWYAYYRGRAADDYELTMSAERIPLKLRSKSILNWTNPLEDGQINGSTFVWEHRGRPIVIGQFFSYIVNDDQRSLCHVFSTLTAEKVQGRRGGRSFWQPQAGATFDWKAATGSIVSTENRAARLVQMRQLARLFQTYTQEATRGKRNLRLLPQPLYRYPADNKQVDGAIFAYVVGNDPELLILVEGGLAKPSEWRYRFVQSTRSTTVAMLEDNEVYRYDGEKRDPSSATAVYLSRHGIELIPRELPVDD